MEAQVDTLSSSHNQKKDNNRFINKNNCQIIELYGSLKTKELRKKHSSGPLGWAEIGSQVGKTCCKATVEGPGRERQWLTDFILPHLHAEKPGRTTVAQDRPQKSGFQHREIKPQNLWGLGWQQEKLSASQESSLERPTGSQNVHKPTHLGISTRRAQFAGSGVSG